jgi:alkanesulfonate monooxygenase SsuD/methylene tetrahydromethanopterin reductase-like flavin-dependent oxidoreductase (luciferase family)
VGRYLDLYKQTARGFGYTASPAQLGWAVPVYVGDTDASALEESAVHMENFRNYFLKMPFEMLLPPGYTSRESMKGMAAAKANLSERIDAGRAIELGLFVCGSAKTVAETLIGHMREIGFGNLLVLLQFGTLPADLTRRNMERFAESVTPLLKREGRALHGELAIA